MSVSFYVSARVFAEMILVKEAVVFMIIVLIMTFVQNVQYKKSIVLAALFLGILGIMEYLALIFAEIIIPDIEKYEFLF